MPRYIQPNGKPLRTLANVEGTVAGRQARNRTNPARRYLGEDGADLERVGVLAELAACQALGLSPEAVVGSRKRRGWNLELPDGTRLDVCGSPVAGLLLVEEGKVRADAYLLVKVDPASGAARLVGWASAERVRAAYVSTVSGKAGAPRNHVIRADLLESWETLRDVHGVRTLPMFGGPG